MLSAGGPTATAFHAGALAALAEIGFDGRRAEVVVGTSAGSSAAAMLRAGFAPADEYARLTRGELSADGAAFASRVRAAGDAVSPTVGGRGTRPLSLRLAAVGLNPLRPRPGLALAGLTPRGGVGLERMGATSRASHPSWPERATWLVTVRVNDGARAVFGRDDLPAIDIGTAVQASSAVPGVYRPMRIGSADYLDGAVHSSTNADLLAGLGLDAVVVVSSMTAVPSRSRCTSRDPVRSYMSRKLGQEVQAIRRAGTPVLVIQPTAADMSLRENQHAHDHEDSSSKIATQARETACLKLSRPEARPVRKVLESA